jgi:C-terminal processing protease CtpA/Prc
MLNQGKAEPSMLRQSARVILIVLAVCLSSFQGGVIAQEKFNKDDLGRARQMLRDAHDNVKKYYYDPKFHGLDWDARYKEYDQKMLAATSNGQCFGIIAAFLDGLNDSHVFFNPPRRPARVDYGFRIMTFGDKAFISRVRPGTDAEKKVHPGDQVVSWNGFSVDRETLKKLTYLYETLALRSTSNLVLRDPSGTERATSVSAVVVQRKQTMDVSHGNDSMDWWQLYREDALIDHTLRQQYRELDDVMIWKMPEFDMTDGEVDHMFNIANNHKTLILDLRENPGGYIVTLERVVGNLFDHDVKIADRVARKEQKPQIGKARRNTTFTGKLFILVDSRSASAAELLARVVQLEKRGIVLGDRSSGSVMEARGYTSTQGTDVILMYQFSVTDADLIMADGKSLEHTGVAPDEIIIPTSEDLAAGKDPVLARAAELAGLKMDSAVAGKLFPYEWLPLQ